MSSDSFNLSWSLGTRLKNYWVSRPDEGGTLVNIELEFSSICQLSSALATLRKAYRPQPYRSPQEIEKLSALMVRPEDQTALPLPAPPQHLIHGGGK